ncbi:efflux transporter outer membrane subunit [Dethiosulfatarculus sandiegensis]|uniref:Transporter n=1 Tax=Dethiosulfatarculus sandiegensis TaxID=1429043 RepID=A0A0D2J1U5_9BACT|nr:efflux transporter outer membrane subunit [Dethiosulfatarculus sandiegensis]KIX12194.1 transporter [Dethiosulfatarculus sandiegensis]
MKPRTLLTLLLVFLLGASYGCAKMGPDFAPPRAPDGGINTYQHIDGNKGPYDKKGRWWETFGDPKLNSLVEKAIAENYNIKKAAAKVLEVRALFTQTESSLYPSLDASGKAARRQVAAPALNRRYETYDLSLAASYEVDLWGRLQRATEAARADLLQAEENRLTVVQSIVAEVASAYLNVEALERRLEVAKRSIEAFRSSLELVEYRYERGLVSVLDLRQARRSLAQNLAVVPQLRLELGKQQQKLSILTGSYPKTEKARKQPDNYFPNLKPVPAGLPSELLLRRPDLRATLASLKALNARVGQAMAERFPKITLTGGFGYTSNALGDLFRPDSQIYNLSGGLMQSLFDAGALEARQKAAEARYEEGLADFAQKSLNAFSEVEGALLTRKELLEKRELTRQSLAEARATRDVAWKRYQHGLTDYLQVLDAQKTYFQVEDNLVLTEQAILTNRVTLHKVLGGDWGSDLNPNIQKAAD